MDDFGSGYSSLHMLKEVPVDRIKLDLHFLTGTGNVEKSRMIVMHMIQLVNDLGMKMIAEGVENEAQARFLHSRGCSEMQGFYFYKPMSVQEFEKLNEKDYAAYIRNVSLNRNDEYGRGYRKFSEFARQRSAAGGFATPFKAMKEMEEALIGKKKAKEKK